MSVFLYVDELEVETATFVWKLRQILSKQAALTSVQLRISASLYFQHRLLPKFAVEKNTSSLLNYRHLCLLFLLFLVLKEGLTRFAHSPVGLNLDNAPSFLLVLVSCHKHG